MQEKNKKILNRIFPHQVFFESFLYVISNSIEKGIPFLLTPIFTKLMSTNDYGITTNVLVVFTILKVFYLFSTPGALQVKYFKLSEKERPNIIPSLILIVGVNFLISLIAIITFNKTIYALSFLGELWLILIAISSVLDSITQIGLTWYRLENKASHFTLTNLAKAVADTGISLLIIMNSNLTWKGRILGLLLTQLISALITIIILYKNNVLRFLNIHLPIFRYSFFFGITIILHELSSWIIAMSDRLFITKMLSPSYTGIYSIAYTLGMVVSLVTTSAIQAWTPWLYKNLNNNSEKLKLIIGKQVAIFAIGVIILGVILTEACNYIIPNFFPPDYIQAISIVPWVTASYVINGIYMVFANLLLFYNKNKTLSKFSFFTAIINFILNYILINEFGLKGAAIATFISFTIMFLLTYLSSQRLYPLKLSNGLQNKD